MTTEKKQTAFNRALTPSPALAAVIGATPQPRTEVVKLMWEYIKANNLQNPQNKREIIADAKLKPIFGAIFEPSEKGWAANPTAPAAHSGRFQPSTSMIVLPITTDARTMRTAAMSVPIIRSRPLFVLGCGHRLVT